ncbi:MAG: hypothetical protein QF376_02855 [Anaerolineales bacterium]|jgi:hypothetical protein|nr:hypothetical protein [Anaerolineales bacterium]HJO33230.1 hypothetical protein [Anaerolineales bacterium]
MPEAVPPTNTDGWGRHGVGLGLLGVSLLGGLLLFAFVARIVPQLPSEIPLHFTHESVADRRGPPQGLFYLPLLGALIWLLNTLTGFGLARQNTLRVGAHLLWATTLAVQLILWVAALRLAGTI